MSYMNDPRENAIDLENHTIWEEDNRKEQRYQWGAMVVDLCDMEVSEYMKNPIVENASNNEENIIEAVTSNTNKVTGQLDEIISVLSKSVIVYYTSFNHENADLLTANDFKKISIPMGDSADINFMLGDPTETLWSEFNNNVISEEELRLKSCNDFYLAVPNNAIKNLVVLQNGSNDITRSFVDEGKSMFEGFALLRSTDIDYFNDEFPTQKNVQVLHRIKILK